jgi:NAD-dependent oxidoreductase involved in siderophore biosynthesis
LGRERTSTEPLRAGVVGLGYAGEQHLKNFVRVPGVEPVALAGLEEERLVELGGRYGVPDLYASWEELVARDDLDIVSIGAPNHLHAPIAVAALEGGRHVLCEKPLARNGAMSRRSNGTSRRGTSAGSTTPRLPGCAATASPAWAAGSPAKSSRAEARS